MAEPQRVLIEGAQLYTPADTPTPGWLVTEGRQIRLLGFGAPPAFPEGAISRRIDARGLHLLPGFVDLHVHGAVGYEVMDCSADGLQAMARFYAQHGVTSFLPTTWTASPEATRAAVELVAAAVGRVPGGATILGAYLEGPYLNADMCGAQDPRHIRRAERAEALALLDLGVIRVLALAPEFPENRWLIAECVRRGVTVTLAHTAATYTEVVEAVALGARQATHTYNRMRPLGHREPGTVGAVLTLPHVRCELIADTIHVHPAAMQLLVDVKGPERVVLVTDAIRGAGLAEGEYHIDDRAVLVRDGAVRLPDGTLAGSILTMDTALRNITKATGRSLAACWRMTSLNALRNIGMSAAKGSLEVGKDADLVLLDNDLAVQMTVAEGAIVYERASARPAGEQ